MLNKRLWLACVVVGVLLVGRAGADVQRLVAVQDPGNPLGSTFGLFFGEEPNIIERSALISSTDFTLDVDLAAGAAGFVSYVQQVPSLDLPGQDEQGQPIDIPTGDIAVTMIPGTGTLVDNLDGTAVFTTTDDYLIEFENDLSALGFPGHSVLFEDVTASGLITFDAGRSVPASGAINLNWGDTVQVGQLPPFSYLCVLDMTFTSVPEPASMSLLALGSFALLRRRR